MKPSAEAVALHASGWKRCGTCREVRGHGEYRRDKYKWDGFVCRCKPCDATARVEYCKANTEKPCRIPGCDRHRISDSALCSMHQNRIKRYGEPGPVESTMGPRGAGHVGSDGYRRITVEGRVILEHRWVMSVELGRPLYRHETVHHLNGDRLDNRPENLELWSSRQPKGQRIVDKVAWAREILDLYGDLAV